MAYQPKSYRKFVATAATATLVASAFAPFASAADASKFKDVSTNYKEAVEFVVSKGINGKSETLFGTTENITRVDAAVMLVKVLGLDTDKAPASGFTDVPSRAVKEVNALKAAGITSGKTETTLDSYANITRGELAVWIQRAFELTGSADVEFKDVNKNYKEAVGALYANKVTLGKTETTFGTTANATRGEFALFLLRASEAAAPEVVEVSAVNGAVTVTLAKAAEKVDADDFTVTQAIDGGAAKEVKASKATLSEDGKKVTLTVDEVAQKDDEQSVVYTVNKVAAKAFIVEGLVAKVTNVSAANPKTLTITGSSLKQLKAEDVTVEGNKVVSVTPAADGKTATLNLETPLLENKDYKVTVKNKLGTKEFTVKYTFNLAEVAVTTTTLEANKDKQYLQVTLNGVAADLASIDSLGYDIEFQADKAVFVGTSGATNVSTTGEIDETATATALNQSFNVKAVLKKDGKTAESKTVTVKVVSAATPAIGNIVLETSELELTKAVVSTKDSSVAVKKVVSNTGDVINVSGLSSFASSNPEVATINAQTGAITPIKAGKTTITVTAGKVVYSKEITVVNEERKATAATAKNATVTVAPGATLTNDVTITDQFGEKLDSSDITLTNFSVSEVTGEAKVTAVNATKDGILPVTAAPAADAKSGAYTVVIKDLTTLKNIGQFTVKVSNDNVADNYKLEVADDSKGVANLAGTKTVTLNAKEFTKSGAYLQTLDSSDTGFTVESANPTVATVASIDADGKIVVTGVKVGTTQIILKKGGVQVATATITVKEEVPVIESIAWANNGATISVKDKAINYKDIFTITSTATGVDPIIDGVKVSVDTTSKVRIDLADTSAPKLYLDKNDNGDLDSNEEILGTVSAKLSGSAGENITLGTDWTSNILSAATASGNKGTIVITVTDDDSNSTVRATSTINVDVK